MTEPETIPPPKSELPITHSIVIKDHRLEPDCGILCQVVIREDGFVAVLGGNPGEITLAWKPLMEAAAAVGRRVARNGFKDAMEEALVKTPEASPIVRRIDEIQAAAGDTLAPETTTLLELAKEAQATGQMPDLSRLNAHEPPCCQ